MGPLEVSQMCEVGVKRRGEERRGDSHAEGYRFGTINLYFAELVRRRE